MKDTINAMDAIRKELEESKFEVSPKKMRQLQTMPKITKNSVITPRTSNCSPGPIYNVSGQSLRELGYKYAYLKERTEIDSSTARNPSPLCYFISRDNTGPRINIRPRLADPRAPLS